MIIGNGLLAGSLKDFDREDCVFLASGVSDSKCSDIVEFQREEKLVKEEVLKHPGKKIIFFSTFSINDPVMNHNMYVESKLSLEEFISQNCEQFLIVRISNLVGKGGNPKTVFNFFISNIVNGNSFSLWASSVRNLIMVEDFARILNFILEHEWDDWKNSIVNIVNAKSYSAGEIVASIESFTGKKADYELVDIVSNPRYEDEHAAYLFRKLNIETDEYLQRILQSYYQEYQSAGLTFKTVSTK